MRIGTKPQPTHAADVTETLSDLVYRNRLAGRGTAAAPVERTTEPVRRKQFRAGRGLFWFIATIIIALGLFLTWQQAVVPWLSNTQDHWNYGASRVTQLDADVGHGGLEHFVAEYYAGAIVVIEIPFATPGKAQVYTLSGMVLDSTDSPVILLGTAKDMHTGRIDLTVTVKGTNFQTVLYNTGIGFSETAP
jgi:hypothetical protein